MLACWLFKWNTQRLSAHARRLRILRLIAIAAALAALLDLVFTFLFVTYAPPIITVSILSRTPSALWDNCWAELTVRDQNNILRI